MIISMVCLPIDCFHNGQKMALRAFYIIKALTFNYINRSQRHLLVAIENNRFGGPIWKNGHSPIMDYFSQTTACPKVPFWEWYFIYRELTQELDFAYSHFCSDFNDMAT